MVKYSKISQKEETKMNIKTLQTNNFQGLKGVQEFDFGKITALAQPNGSGKTSLINALRYGLTGVEPSGDMITKGSVSTAVRVTFDSGSSFLRQKFAEKGKNAKYYVGNSQTTLSKLNDFISHEMGGVDINTAKFISSGELLTSMTSQQFGEMLLQYLPEAMTTNTVLERFPGANKEQQKIIKECLPDGEFGVDALNDFHKLLVERRKMIKQALAQKEAVLASLGTEAPVFTVEQLNEEIQKLLKKRDELVKLDANMRYYTNIENQIKQRDAQVAAIDQQIQQLQAMPLDMNEVQLIEEQMKDIQKQLESIQSVMAAFVKIKTALDKAAEKLSGADKEELLEASKEVSPMYSSQRDLLLSVGEKLKGLAQRRVDAQKRAEENRANQLAEKTTLKNQLLAQELVLPDKPEASGSMQELDQHLAKLQNLIPVVENWSKKDQIANQITEYTKKHSDYDGLVLAFSPKGEVKEAITSYYMDEFAEPCNVKAKKLFNGMSLKFVTDKGVKVLTDPNGSGEYLEFSSLSGGEQASVMFLLVNMLSTLSGMGIIILDELSVLDDEVFANLIKVLVENQDEYDMCLLASVDHVDTLATLNKYNIPILSVNGGMPKSTAKSKKDESQKTTVSTTREEVVTEEDDVAVAPNFDSVDENLVDLKLEEDNQIDNPATTEIDKSKQLGDLKSLMEKTAIKSADKRFVPEDDNDLDEGLSKIDVSLEDEQSVEPVKEDKLKTLGLGKGKSSQIVGYIIEHADDNHIFNGTAKDISDTLNISQPTVGKVLKLMQEADLIISLKRGAWELSEGLLS